VCSSADFNSLAKSALYLSSSMAKVSFRLSNSRYVCSRVDAERMANVLARFVPGKCFTSEIEGAVENNRHVWRSVRN
jgi:hypothetical protein